MKKGMTRAACLLPAAWALAALTGCVGAVVPDGLTVSAYGDAAPFEDLVIEPGAVGASGEEDVIRFTLQNDSDETVLFAWDAVSLEVYLNRTWYKVPKIPAASTWMVRQLSAGEASKQGEWGVGLSGYEYDVSREEDYRIVLPYALGAGRTEFDRFAVCEFQIAAPKS